MDNTMVIMDLEEMAGYLEKTNKLMNDFCEAQSIINGKYNTLTDLWWDKISKATGDRIRNAHRYVGQLLEGFRKKIKDVNEESRGLNNNYLKEGEWNVTITDIKIETKVRETDGMEKKRIKGTTPAGIKAFEKALRDYINETRKRLDSVKSAYEEIGGTWRDSQYSKTGTEVSDFSQNLKKELDELEVLLAKITERRIAFETAISKRIKNN